MSRSRTRSRVAATHGRCSAFASGCSSARTLLWSSISGEIAKRRFATSSGPSRSVTIQLSLNPLPRGRRRRNPSPDGTTPELGRLQQRPRPRRPRPHPPRRARPRRRPPAAERGGLARAGAPRHPHRHRPPQPRRDRRGRRAPPARPDHDPDPARRHGGHRVLVAVAGPPRVRHAPLLRPVARALPRPRRPHARRDRPRTAGRRRLPLRHRPRPHGPDHGAHLRRARRARAGGGGGLRAERSHRGLLGGAARYAGGGLRKGHGGRRPARLPRPRRPRGAGSARASSAAGRRWRPAGATPRPAR